MMRLPSICVLLLLFSIRPLQGQAHGDALSEREVESLREAADKPAERVLVFEQILDARIGLFEELATKPPTHDRTDAMHTLLQQFAEIAVEMEENLETYQTAHQDLRKALPKVLASTRRWAIAVQKLPTDDLNQSARQYAFDTLEDIRNQVESMIPEQAAWFKQHPAVANTRVGMSAQDR